MNTFTQIHVDDPCGEDWEKMQAREEGRFCSSCSRTVVDFTAMSDREVLTWLSGAGRSVCGRFMGDQLSRNLSAGEEVKQRKRGFWNLLLAGLLLSSKAPAQTPVLRPETHQNAPERSDDLPVVAGKIFVAASDRLNGKILDSASGQPVPGANLAIGNRHFVTDDEGHFNIPAAGIHAGMTMTVSSVGYQHADIVIDKGWLSGKQRVITLSSSVMGLMEVVVVGSSTVKGKMTLTCSSTTTIRRLIRDSLAFPGIPKKEFEVYPNPVRRGAAATLSINGGRPGEWLVQLVSASGMLVESMVVQGGEKARVELMNIPPSLAAGVYFIKMSRAGGDKVYTKELMVM